MPDSPPVLRRMKRDVLTMLRVELRQAQAGETRIIERSSPVDRDYVEMLRETIAEIESRAPAAIVLDPDNETQRDAVADAMKQTRFASSWDEQARAVLTALRDMK